jgi:hypothetical protein
MTKSEALSNLTKAADIITDIAQGKIALIDIMPLSMQVADMLEDTMGFVEDINEEIGS